MNEKRDGGKQPMKNGKNQQQHHNNKRNRSKREKEKKRDEKMSILLFIIHRHMRVMRSVKMQLQVKHNNTKQGTFQQQLRILDNKRGRKSGNFLQGYGKKEVML